ncbi:class Ib ribonucleoside-diphosphate reductase assembly flavoprotein NrdI, partial [Staphylococcus epidermidis]|uniref:class Ib ribonucleoside-diphosphate reductase assembly flavoprotein NrdI n=1 Tax=Staphylococcus epidermidis TaxID=1282 RepID=UPI0037D9F65A
MKLLYYSFSPNLTPFISPAPIKHTFQITQHNSNQSLNQPYILLTPTIPFPHLPHPLQSFLNLNHTQ